MNNLERKQRDVEIVLILVVLFLVPILLNFLLPIQRFTSVIGNDKDWLSFFGSYLGSIIAAGISFFVMYKTLQYHKKEDEYRHKVEWLNDFRKVCGEYVSVFNVDNVLSIVKEMTIDSCKASENCYIYQQQLHKEEIKLSLFIADTRDEKLVSLSRKMKAFQESYQEMFSDVSQIVFRVWHAIKGNGSNVVDIPIECLNYNGISFIMNDMIKTYVNTDERISISDLYTILYKRTIKMSDSYDDISEACKQCILGKSIEIESIKQ